MDWDDSIKQSKINVSPLFSGLSISIGMHTDEPTMLKVNNVSRRMDYFGQVLNLSPPAGCTAAAIPGCSPCPNHGLVLYICISTCSPKLLAGCEPCSTGVFCGTSWGNCNECGDA